MEKSNSSIKCTVTNCAFNNTADQHCTLNTIKVGTSGALATKPEGTECDSFELSRK